MLFTINRNPSRSELTQFAFIILIGFGIIATLVAWRWGLATVARAIGAIDVVLFVTILVAPRIGRKIYVGWMLGAAGMGTLLFPVFLTVAFFVFLPVFSLIRLADPLRLKLKREGTYWEPHKRHEPTIERMRRPF